MEHTTSAAQAADLEAEGYLESVGGEFQSLERRIIDMQHRAALVAGRARELGQTAEYNTGIDIIRKLGALNQEYDAARSTWASVRRWVPGLGAIPVFLVMIVAALAAAVAAVFRQADLEEHRLQLLEEGLLTPAELAKIQQGGLGPLAQLVPLALAGGLAWILWQRGGL